MNYKVSAKDNRIPHHIVKVSKHKSMEPSAFTFIVVLTFLLHATDEAMLLDFIPFK